MWLREWRAAETEPDCLRTSGPDSLHKILLGFLMSEWKVPSPLTTSSIALVLLYPAPVRLGSAGLLTCQKSSCPRAFAPAFPCTCKSFFPDPHLVHGFSSLMFCPNMSSQWVLPMCLTLKLKIHSAASVPPLLYSSPLHWSNPKLK